MLMARRRMKARPTSAKTDESERCGLVYGLHVEPQIVPTTVVMEALVDEAEGERDPLHVSPQIADERDRCEDKARLKDAALRRCDAPQEREFVVLCFQTQ